MYIAPFLLFVVADLELDLELFETDRSVTL